MGPDLYLVPRAKLNGPRSSRHGVHSWRSTEQGVHMAWKCFELSSVESVCLGAWELSLKLFELLLTTAGQDEFLALRVPALSERFADA